MLFGAVPSPRRVDLSNRGCVGHSDEGRCCLDEDSQVFQVHKDSATWNVEFSRKLMDADLVGSGSVCDQSLCCQRLRFGRRKAYGCGDVRSGRVRVMRPELSS